MLHDRSRFETGDIVVHCQKVSGGIVKTKQRIQRRIETAGIDLHHNRLSRFQLKMEKLDFSGLVESSSDHDAAPENAAAVRVEGRNGKVRRCGDRIGTGSFLHGNAVDKVFPSAIERIADRQRVDARLRNLEFQRPVGIEVGVVHKGDAPFLRVENLHLRLEKPRNAVPDERHQSAAEHGECESLSALCMESEEVGFSGHDLPVEDRRNAEFRGLRFIRRKGKERIARLLVRPDKKGERIADASIGEKTELSPPRLGFRRNPELHNRDAGNRRTRLKRIARNQKKTEHLFALKRFEGVDPVIIGVLHPSGGILRKRGTFGDAFADRPEPAHDVFALRGGGMRKSADRFDSRDGNAVAGNQSALQSPELLSADQNFDIAAPPGSRRQQVADVDRRRGKRRTQKEKCKDSFVHPAPPSR